MLDLLPKLRRATHQKTALFSVLLILQRYQQCKDFQVPNAHQLLHHIALLIPLIDPRRDKLRLEFQALLDRIKHSLHLIFSRKVKPLVTAAEVITVDFGFFALEVNTEDETERLLQVELNLLVAKVVALLEGGMRDFAYIVLVVSNINKSIK
jgi:hypothetical protein